MLPRRPKSQVGDRATERWRKTPVNQRDFRPPAGGIRVSAWVGCPRSPYDSRDVGRCRGVGRAVLPARKPLPHRVQRAGRTEFLNAELPSKILDGRSPAFPPARRVPRAAPLLEARISAALRFPSCDRRKNVTDPTSVVAISSLGCFSRDFGLLPISPAQSGRPPQVCRLEGLRDDDRENRN